MSMLNFSCRYQSAVQYDAPIPFYAAPEAHYLQSREVDVGQSSIPHVHPVSMPRVASRIPASNSSGLSPLKEGMVPPSYPPPSRSRTPEETRDGGGSSRSMILRQTYNSLLFRFQRNLKVIEKDLLNAFLNILSKAPETRGTQHVSGGSVAVLAPSFLRRPVTFQNTAPATNQILIPFTSLLLITLVQDLRTD